MNNVENSQGEHRETSMRKGLEETARRTRTIKWKVSTDVIAKKLARQRYSEINVSRLLEELVFEEAERVASMEGFLNAKGKEAK